MAPENLEITLVLNIDVLFANCFSNGFFKLLYTYSLNVLTINQLFASTCCFNIFISFLSKYETRHFLNYVFYYNIA